MRASRPGQSPLLLLDVVRILKREKVEYAVIGSLAAAVYGAIRASVDADALVSLPADKLSSLARAFRGGKNFTVEFRRGDPDDPVVAMLVIGDKHQNRVDLIGGLRGLDPAILTRAVEVPFQDEALRVVGREDFIAMKCFAGAPKDSEEARIALATAESFDLDLLRRLTRRFGRPAADALEMLLAAAP